MLLIDRRGQRVRPVCSACRRLSQEPVPVRRGRVFVCKPCLKKPSVTVEIAPLVRRAS